MLIIYNKNAEIEENIASFYGEPYQSFQMRISPKSYQCEDKTSGIAYNSEDRQRVISDAWRQKELETVNGSQSH